MVSILLQACILFRFFSLSLPWTVNVINAKALSNLKTSIGTDHFHQFILLTVLVTHTCLFPDLPPLLPWTVWRHKGKDSTNLKTNWNWPFPLGSSSILFSCSQVPLSNLPLSFLQTVWRHKCHTLTISSINSKKPVQPVHLLICSVV